MIVEDDIGQILAESPPGRFRQAVAAWPVFAQDQPMVDQLIQEGWITEGHRRLATYAVQAARDTGLPHLAVDLALALDRLGMALPLGDDPALATAVAVAWARR